MNSTSKISTYQFTDSFSPLTPQQRQQLPVDNAIQESKICDLQKPGEIPHKLGSHSLVTDPLKRIKKITNTDGTEVEQVMKLCRSCYQRALVGKQTQEGMVCDFQVSGEKPHELNLHTLRTDPLKRIKKIIDTDGTELEQMMKLCQSCYVKALREKKQEVKIGDLQASGEIPQQLNAPNFTPDSPHRVEPIATSTTLSSVIIKKEPVEDEFELEAPDEECYFVKRKRIEHLVDNTLPILQDPQDSSRSMLLEVEGDIANINTVRWGCIDTLTPLQKYEIKEQMRDWLRLNEYDRDEYTKKLEESFEVAIPVGFGPNRGRAVYAKKAIRQYEVIGPYSGKLHTTTQSLDRSIRHNGSYDVLSYLFSTRSIQRSVDAFNAGNTMSLVNTSQLPGSPAWADDNIASITFGKNLTFYIALKDIEIGDELLLDYGPLYNPMSMIKQEDEEVRLESRASDRFS
ncbi:MAG: SET domain-containing protein-lysine N-methyltransferase [Parachlamydiaceae bacterium]